MLISTSSLPVLFTSKIGDHEELIVIYSFYKWFLFPTWVWVNIFLELMLHTIERTLFMWEKGRGDKCCPRPESCLPRARPALGASVSKWHITPWDGCHGVQRQGDVYLCQAPQGMAARGSGCTHHFLPELRQPRHRFSVGLKGCRQQHLSPEPFIKKNNNYDGITKIVLLLTIGRPGITSQMEQIYTRRLQNL